PGVTSPKAVHVLELRQAVDALRATAGLSPSTWTDAVLTAGTSTARVIHVSELRARLDEAFVALGYAVTPYTDPRLAADTTVIRPGLLGELRARVQHPAGATVAYYHTDAIGSVRMTTRQSG